MMELECYTNADLKTPLQYLVQWSQYNGVFIKADIESPILFFSNDYTDYAITNRGINRNGKYVYADIPNILLQDPVPITIGIAELKDGIYTQNYFVKIPVKESAKPQDYKFEDNINKNLVSDSSLELSTATIDETLEYLGIKR